MFGLVGHGRHVGKAFATDGIVAALLVLGCVLSVEAGWPESQTLGPTDDKSEKTPPVPVTLVVRIHGGLVSAEASRVVSMLVDQRIVPVEKHIVSDGESICAIYEKTLKVPGRCSSESLKLAKKLNGAKAVTSLLQPGDEIAYPGVAFETFTYSMRFAPQAIPGDKDRLKEVRRNWNDLILEDRNTSEGYVQLQLRGYELRVSLTTDQYAAVRSMLGRLQSANVTVGLVASEPQAKPYHTVTSEPRKFIRRCYKRQAKYGEQGSLLRLLGSESLPACSKCRGQQCSGLIVLVDSAVHRHPDISDGVIFTEGKNGHTQVLKPGDDQECEELGTFDEAVNHGTFMAGIIGGRNKEWGLRGVDPDAQIYSIRWDRSSRELAVKDAMDSQNQNGSQRIFVFASEWSTKKDRGVGSAFRFRHPIATLIRDAYLIFIAAAGGTTTGDGDDIDTTYESGPMNLGDQPNTLIVTACDECEPTTARLEKGANYSRHGMVHVAAPGKDIPSVASERAYTIQDGTSPATALVAGLASALVRCYPNSYGTVGRLKERIQYTSRPILGADGDKVAAGVVDARLALLDPDKSYLQVQGRNLEATVVQGWCVPEISLLDATTGYVVGRTGTKDLFRLVQVGDPTRQQWVAYSRNYAAPGAVMKIGPGTLGPVLTGPPGARFSNLDKPLLLIEGDRAIALRSIEDLLVRPGGQLLADKGKCKGG